jgi:hypothetical protein
MWRNGSRTQHILTTAADGGEWAAAYALAPLTPNQGNETLLSTKQEVERGPEPV